MLHGKQVQIEIDVISDSYQKFFHSFLYIPLLLKHSLEIVICFIFVTVKTIMMILKFYSSRISSKWKWWVVKVHKQSNK